MVAPTQVATAPSARTMRSPTSPRSRPTAFHCTRSPTSPRTTIWILSTDATASHPSGLESRHPPTNLSLLRRARPLSGRLDSLTPHVNPLLIPSISTDRFEIPPSKPISASMDHPPLPARHSVEAARARRLLRQLAMVTSPYFPSVALPPARAAFRTTHRPPTTRRLRPTLATSPPLLLSSARVQQMNRLTGGTARPC